MSDRDGTPIIQRCEYCILAAILIAYMTVDAWVDYLIGALK